MSEDFVDLSRAPERLAAMLRQMGLEPGPSPPRVETLTGGVSSLLLKVTLPALTVCVKQALPRLRVAKEWCVPTHRVFAEVAWLQRAQAVIPGHVPRVFGVDRSLMAFVMEYLPAADYGTWKSALLAGNVQLETAGELGALLGRVHAATADDADTARAFANEGNFFALRLEPYLVETARAHPDLHQRLHGLVTSFGANKRALVHGDISPKNILIGGGPMVLLDAECACYGDPAFDVAFPLSHLLLKALHHETVGSAVGPLTAALLNSYVPYIEWENPATLLARAGQLLPALLLARVDGKSPVEYLDDRQRDFVRRQARGMLQGDSDAPAALVAQWRSAIAGAAFG